MRSLRAKLMLGIAVVATGIFLAAATAIFLLARASLIAQFDAATLAKARAISLMVEWNEGQIKHDELDEAHLTEFERGERREFFQLWNASGQTLLRSKSLGDHNLIQNAT